MNGPERRQTPRTTIEKHAYINIEPDNGGIVLNVSDGGFCFHSFDPVLRNGKVRFWFSDNGRRIEGDGTLAWMDETQKGGLRFATMPAEAREKIREWMNQPVTTPVVPAKAVAAGPRPQELASPLASLPDTKAAPVHSNSLAIALHAVKAASPSGFSRGLMTGLLLSVVMVTGILFHDYRRELGETLIELGQRFAAQPQAQSTTASTAGVTAAKIEPITSRTLEAAPRTTSPTLAAAPPSKKDESAAPAAKEVARSQSIPARAEKVAAEPEVRTIKLQPAKLESAAETSSPPVAAGDVPSPATAAATISQPGPTMASLTPAPIAASTSAAPTVPATADASGSSSSKAASKLELSKTGIQTEGSDASDADSARELYFEVGKFKNVFQARDETEKLAQLGFPASAVEKGHLWANSFHVLVGPYPDEDQAKATHENLVTSGFKPRPFEKGWRSFTLLSSVTLNGARTPEGEYVISWESYIGDASVKFLHNSMVVASAGGRWVKRDAKYPRDAYVYRRNPDGSRTLLEIHFGGMRQALVFGKG